MHKRGIQWMLDTKVGQKQQECMKWDFHSEFTPKLFTVHKAGWMEVENKACFLQRLLLWIQFKAVQGAGALGGLEFQSS